MFIDITDRILMEQEKERLAEHNVYLQEEIKSVHNFDEIIGKSPALPTSHQLRIFDGTSSGRPLPHDL